MRAYLDAMDRAPFRAVAPSTEPERVLAALGPRMLGLAAERAAGAHTYFVPPEHTARARKILGADRLLAVEQAVVLERDAARAREIARLAHVRLPQARQLRPQSAPARIRRDGPRGRRQRSPGRRDRRLGRPRRRRRSGARAPGGGRRSRVHPGADGGSTDPPDRGVARVGRRAPRRVRRVIAPRRARRNRAARAEDCAVPGRSARPPRRQRSRDEDQPRQGAREPSRSVGPVRSPARSGAMRCSPTRTARSRWAASFSSPRARTYWHRHADGQVLYVTHGQGRVRSRDGSGGTIAAGDVIHFAPGEEHWHGAAPDSVHAAPRDHARQDRVADRSQRRGVQQSVHVTAGPDDARVERSRRHSPEDARHARAASAGRCAVPRRHNALRDRGANR